MAKSRYWKLEPQEVAGFSYPEPKLLNWDIKCIREPEEGAVFIGVFMYRHGTPLDYESVKGVAFFHNNISRDEVPKITKFLKGRLGGSPHEKSERVFLKGSDEIYSGKDIAELAGAMNAEFGTRAVITLEFDGLTDEERSSSGLPDAKLLPIPGK